MTRSVSAVILALLTLSSGTAAGADLVDVFRQAQSSDAAYGGARATWAAAQERIPQGRAGLLPLASLALPPTHRPHTRFRDESIPRAIADFGSTTNRSSPADLPAAKRHRTHRAFTQVEQAILTCARRPELTCA